MWEVYGGGFVLLWVCSIFLADSKNPLPGILRCSVRLEDTIEKAIQMEGNRGEG